MGIGTTFPLGILIIAVEGFAETLNLGTEGSNFFMSFIRAAFLEETMKFFVIIFYCLHLDVFDEPMDALVYGVAASLGFAVIENWEYVLIGVMAVDKAVALSPSTWDDLLWTSVQTFELELGKFLQISTASEENHVKIIDFTHCLN